MIEILLCTALILAVTLVIGRLALRLPRWPDSEPSPPGPSPRPQVRPSARVTAQANVAIPR